jgi:hypothetical protein
MPSRFVGTYCASGPYRHVRGVLAQQSHAWLPWGYRLGQDAASALRITPGDQIELWEVNDTRAPRSAVPVAVLTVDFVSVSSEYLALTLQQARSLAPLSTEQDVVTHVQSRRFIWKVESPRVNDGFTPVTRSHGNTAPHRSPLQAAISAFSLG